DARRVRVAQSLSKVLVRAARSPRRIPGGRKIFFAEGKNMATQNATKPSLTIKRRLNAPPAKVFAAWTDPEKIKSWFGPGQVQCTHVAFDLRVGGHYVIAAQSPDGEKHQVGGVVREVVKNEKLVYTWAWHTMPERES